MKTILCLTIASLFAGSIAQAQTQPPPQSTPPVQQRQPAVFNLTEYGVSFQTEPRLIVMMAALEAAGFDATPGSPPSAFRALVRKDLADLDPDLVNRLRTFYQRNKLPEPATPADQAARYVSLALALGPPPGLEAPTRSTDLPASLLEVLDFTPLVQEFFRRSQIEEKLVNYTRAYQAEGDRMRKPTADMVREVLSYLHTRPVLSSLERERIQPKPGSKSSSPLYRVREHQRNFAIVPDLLGAPGAINFRIIRDDYYAVVPEGTDPTSSELRRAYLQYVIDPLMLRFNREIAAQRTELKHVLAAAEKQGAKVSPDIFLTIARSMVAAADARFDESSKLLVLSRSTRAKLAAARDDATRQSIAKTAQIEMAAIQDETVARLAEDYERGAVLSFYFADQLKGIETTGFDLASFFPDMISGISATREATRLADNATARQRALAARQARLSAKPAESIPNEVEASRTAVLLKRLSEIEPALRVKDYPNAESRLKDLLKEYPGEPRLFFALAQTASLAAADATDEDVQAERLNRALGNFRLAVEAASPETDRAIVSRAHEAMGRIHSFFENKEEAAKHFDEAIKIGDIPGGAYKEAVEGKRKLAQP